MDQRAMTSHEVMLSGVLDLPPVASRCPASTILKPIADDAEVTSHDLHDGLIRGGLKANQRHGCWRIWKAENGFSGELVQHRRVTEEFTHQPIGFALEKAEDWLIGCADLGARHGHQTQPRATGL